MKYRKKPVVIDAVRWNGEQLGLTNGVTPDCDPNHGERLDKADWMPPVKTVWFKAEDPIGVAVGEVHRQGDSLLIGTLEGVHRANPGDYILRGVKGELYPCREDIFKMTYEPADDHAS